MANEKITIRVSAQCSEADIDSNGNLFISPKYDRFDSANAYQSLRLAFNFGALSLTAGGVEFNGVLEAENLDGSYSPMAYTFNSFSQQFAPRADEIYVSGNVNWADGGVPNGFFIGGQTVAQISYNPVDLPDNWRCAG